MSPSTSFAFGVTLTLATGSKWTPGASSIVPSRMSINPFAPHGLRSLIVPRPVLTRLPKVPLTPGCRMASTSRTAPSSTLKVVAAVAAVPCRRWQARAQMREVFCDGNTVIGPFRPQPFQVAPPATPSVCVGENCA